MAFTRKTEVRHISQAELIKIAEILNQPSTSPAWKKVMQIVPHELTHHEQLSDGKPKYNIQHIKSIETAGARRNNAAQIFLEEWITSGRIRPTLGHLLQLMVKSELFRAADYVAINLLNESPPQRPQKGPAAKIDISLPEDNSIDELVNGNYPNTSEIMDLNRCDEAVSKNIVSKQIFGGSLMPDSPISEEDLIRFSSASLSSENVNATPAHTTNGFPHRPERHSKQMKVSLVNRSRSSQHRTNDTNSTTSANKSSSSSRTNNESTAQSVSTSDSPHNFVPNFQLFNSRANYPENLHSQLNDVDNSILSTLNVADGTLSTAGQRKSLDDNVRHLPQLINSSRSTLDNREPEQNTTDQQESFCGNVPDLSMSHSTSGYAPHLSELMQQNNTQTNSSSSTVKYVDQLSSTKSIPPSHNFVPNFFLLNNRSSNSNNLHWEPTDHDIPNLSILNIGNGKDNDLNATEHRESLEENVSHLSQLTNSARSMLGNGAPRLNSTDQLESSSGYVPHFSQLMSSSHSVDNRAPGMNSAGPQESSSGFVPQFSQLMNSSQSVDNEAPDQQESYDGYAPVLSQLMNESTDSVVPGA